MKLNEFKEWLSVNTDYSKATVSDIVSRVKRADKILHWFDNIIYQFMLEQQDEYKALSSSVRSQIKRAVKLYSKFIEQSKLEPLITSERTDSMKVLSLFANIGVSEAYLKNIGFDVTVANELVERRAKLYSKIYPDTKMICGDITQKDIFDRIVLESRLSQVDIVMATPPCQGMSTAGQQDENDERNKLICPAINVIKELQPKYVFLENVPMFLNTSITLNQEKILIPDWIDKELGENYYIQKYIIDTKEYSVPQTRERAIILMTRRDLEKVWEVPTKDDKIVTMRDAIGHLPILDPYVTDITEEELKEMFPHYHERAHQAMIISKWHKPPHHVKRQVVAMQHTPTGCTAFDNKEYYPKKANGDAVRGYRNTYKRQNWDTPAYTVTMDNRKISSQNNVHPGRFEYTDGEGYDIYSDARTLTLYELMIVMSLPIDWPVPDDTSEAFLRRIIGEGIPPLFIKKVFENLDRSK